MKTQGGTGVLLFRGGAFASPGNYSMAGLMKVPRAREREREVGGCICIEERRGNFNFRLACLSKLIAMALGFIGREVAAKSD